MKIEESDKIKGLKIIHPNVFRDERGYFVEKYNKSLFEELNLPTEWIQDNYSFSKRGVIRGLHIQLSPNTQAKLVTCHIGEILDIVIDLRKESKTFGEFFSIKLSEENAKLFYIPKGFAHGFSVLSKEAYVSYKIIGKYDRNSEVTINPLDNDLNLNWQVEESIISEKDKKNSLSFNQFKELYLNNIDYDKSQLN